MIYNVASSLASDDTVSIELMAPSPTACQFLFLLSDCMILLVPDLSSKPVVLPGAISPVAFSPNGSKIVSAYLGHTLQL